MEWTREIPTRPGYYLRLNAGHLVELRHFYKYRGGRYLCVRWGWYGEEREINSRMKRWKYRLNGWQWFGPIPEPEIKRYAKAS